RPRAQADPFFARGLQLVVDGADPDMLEGVLLGEAVLARRRREQDARVFETAGGYAPTMGIIGTVMGLIHVLGNLENPSELGPAIAVAFLATFYGIFTANVFWLPVSQRLKENAAAEAEYRQLITEGLLAIQQGDNPAIVREKLRAFLSHSGESAGAGARGAVARETA
ncbi:MAG: MotA/TolQ/ExbB proton channel family protein, partial [Clostridia bacterium]|nr:MotA/TolQ/ExbB proton channel family protein [Clostridia bacterium]